MEHCAEEVSESFSPCGAAIIFDGKGKPGVESFLERILLSVSVGPVEGFKPVKLSYTD